MVTVFFFGKSRICAFEPANSEVLRKLLEKHPKAAEAAD